MRNASKCLSKESDLQSHTILYCGNKCVETHLVFPRDVLKREPMEEGLICVISVLEMGHSVY